MNLIGMREGAVREWVAANPQAPEAPEAVDFLERRGRFAGLEPSTPEREQVLPRVAPPVSQQTHEGTDYHDGA